MPDITYLPRNQLNFKIKEIDLKSFNRVHSPKVLIQYRKNANYSS